MEPRVLAEGHYFPFECRGGHSHLARVNFIRSQDVQISCNRCGRLAYERHSYFEQAGHVLAPVSEYQLARERADDAARARGFIILD